MNHNKQDWQHARGVVKLVISGLDGYWPSMLLGKVYNLLSQTSNRKTFFVEHVERNNSSLLESDHMLKKGSRPLNSGNDPIRSVEA